MCEQLTLTDTLASLPPFDSTTCVLCGSAINADFGSACVCPSCRSEQQTVNIQKYRGVKRERQLQYRRDYWHRRYWHDTQYRERHLEYDRSVKALEYRKGGKHYAKTLKYNTTGLQGDRNRIRWRDAYIYRPYKRVIDPNGLTEVHHAWIEGTAEHLGCAVVEKEWHRFGVIVGIKPAIKILNGKLIIADNEA
jgi:hypothetical protein